MGKKKPAAAPKPAAAKHAAADDWRGTAAARGRMYPHGAGGCFPLSFPRAKKRDYRVLIDCGIILGTPKGEDAIAQVVKDLQAETTDGGGKPAIDVLVATHEHWDHLSAFATAQGEFDKFDIGQVWVAWTEDRKNGTANQLRSERAAKLKSLQLGVAQLRLGLSAAGALGADGESGPAAADFRRAAEVLTFFGIDPDKPLEGLDGLGAAGKSKLGITDAMQWCSD